MSYFKNYPKSRARLGSTLKPSALTLEKQQLLELERRRLFVGALRATIVGGVIGAGLVGLIVWLVSALG